MAYDADELDSIEGEGDFDEGFLDEEVSAGPEFEDVQESDDLDLDEQMQDVEKRLEIAACYRALLNDTMFSKQSTASRVVEKRMRDFIRSELKVLLGVQRAAAPVESTFSEEQVDVLKRIADKVIGKPTLTEAPQLRRRAVAAPPPPKKAETTAPQLRQRPAPAPKTAPRKEEPPTQPAPKQRKGRKQVDPSSLPKGAVVTGTGRIKRQYLNGSTGAVIATQDLTPQAMNPNRLPMPTGDALTAVTERQAAESVSKLGPVGAGLASIALKTEAKD